MDLKFWKGFAAAELKIAGDEVMLFAILRNRRGREEEKHGKELYGVEPSHFRPPTFKRNIKVTATAASLRAGQPARLVVREKCGMFPLASRFTLRYFA